MITFASLCDTFGRYIAGAIDFIPKRLYLPLCLLRAVFFTATYMLTYEGVAKGFFGADWFIILNLGLFAWTCGYWSTVGMKFGSDETT